MKRLAVNLDIWQWQGTVVTGGTAETFKELLRDCKLEPGSITEFAAGASHIEEGVPWFIWVEKPDDFETLAHEALHVTFYVLGSRGLEHCEASEEAYTYTMDAITRTVKRAKSRDWKRV